jgi:hypothetical protein
MQTHRNHADIRIPASRPDFSGCQNLQDCSIEQLRWLATQQGFAGITQVQSRLCQWQRELDFQPSNGARDIGEMVFADADTMLETGVDAAFFEIWKKVEQSHLYLNTHQFRGANRHGVTISARLLRAGSQFAYVRPRSVAIPGAASLIDAIDTHRPSHEALMDWLDFEISFGEVLDEEHFQILHSTLPFREGCRLDVDEVSSYFVT